MSGIHKHEPVPEEAMQWSSPDNTICETLRRIYHKTTDDDLRLELRTATAMAKSMSRRLEEYKRNWKQGFYEPNDAFPRHHRKSIDVLILCYDDNSNTMYRFWQCARFLGLNAVMFKGKKHAFGYPVQAPLHPSLSNKPIYSAPTTIMAPGLESLLQAAHLVHLGASTFPMAAVDWSKMNVVVQHGGTVYRQYPDACNSVFNSIAGKSIIQTPDLLGLGAKNEHWIYFPVDTGLLQPDFRDRGTIPIVGHFPSNPDVKGTAVISEAVRSAGDAGAVFEYRQDTKQVPWPQHLKRMSECDIIIEGCSPKQGSKAYGEWGNQALEASALGCAVITHNHHNALYEKEYSAKFAPVIANDRYQIIRALCDLRDVERLRQKKYECRQWVEQNHSIPATAHRLWDKVYGGYFGGV